jgi:hypothetical protein
MRASFEASIGDQMSDMLTKQLLVLGTKEER